VIQNVKKRVAEIASSLPKSVEIVPVYDRSNLINAAIDTLKNTSAGGVHHRCDWCASCSCCTSAARWSRS
jgi:hypothetical protein